MLGAYASFSVAEYGCWIAMLVYGDAQYGSKGATAMVLVQLVPSILLTPYSGSLADRLPPARVLKASYMVQAALLGAAACDVALHGPAPVVFVLAACATFALDVVRPARAALLPHLARTPTELTTANVLTGWIEGAGFLVGPALFGLIMATGGVRSAIVVGAAANVIAATLLVSRGNAGARPAGAGAAEREPTVLACLRTASSTPATQLLLVLTAFCYALLGALDIFCVLLAADVFHLGRGGAGFLNAAIGAGATVAGLATFALAGRPHLARLTTGSLVAAIAALVLIGASPPVAGTAGLLAVVGFMGTVFVTVSRTLLQRVASPDATGATFAAIGAVMNFGLATGAVVVQAAIAIGGLRTAFFALPVVGAVLLALTWWRLRAADEAASIPQVEIRLLRSLSLFAHLSTPVLENVARQLHAVSAPPGAVLVREGELGDRYDAVADGRLRVTRDGALLRTLGRGTGFGEIALITASPRTATVTAETSVLVYSIDKDAFLGVIAGSLPSRAAADHLIASYADPALSRLTGSGPLEDPSGAIEST